MTEILYNISRIYALFACIAVTGFSLAYLVPYWYETWKLKKHIIFAIASTIFSHWAMYWGYEVHIWFKYPNLASLMSNIAYTSMLLSLYFLYQHRQEKKRTNGRYDNVTKS